MSIFWELLNQPICIIFTFLMLIVFAVDFVDIFKNPTQCDSNLRGTLVNLGLLGTFIGIFLGLLNFDSSSTEAISNSVPNLLNGLRFAFVTSIIGIALMTLLNVIESFRRRFQPVIADKTPQENIYQAKMIELLESMTQAQQEISQQYNETSHNQQTMQTLLERILQQLRWIDLQADNPATQRLTKLDQQGQPLPIEAPQWSAILDKTTQKTWLLGSPLHPQLSALIKEPQITPVVKKINTEKIVGYNDWDLPQSADFKILYGLIQRAGFEAFFKTQDCWYYVQAESDVHLYQLELDQMASGEKGHLLVVRS